MATTRKRAKRRKKVEPSSRGLTPREMCADDAPAAVTKLAGQVGEDGGAVIGCYREPLGGNWQLAVSLPIERVAPTPFQRDVWSDVEQAIMPLVKKLQQAPKSEAGQEIENVVAALKALLSTNNDDADRRYSRLTSRESEICELIKQGLSSKEITEKLNLSLLTVHKHREQIRKKLGIVNLDVSLATYLRYH